MLLFWLQMKWKILSLLSYIIQLIQIIIDKPKLNQSHIQSWDGMLEWKAISFGDGLLWYLVTCVFNRRKLSGTRKPKKKTEWFY